MSILIKGMEMPECCDECVFMEIQDSGFGNDYICSISKEDVDGICDCPLIEVPEDVQPVKWIPVTESLPNGNGKYLVSGNDKVWVCEFMILGDVGGWCNSAMNPCVKYWMPLPELPKDGEV